MSEQRLVLINPSMAMAVDLGSIVLANLRADGALEVLFRGCDKVTLLPKSETTDALWKIIQEYSIQP